MTATTRVWERLSAFDPRWRPILTALFLLVSAAAITLSAVRDVHAPPGDYPTFGPPGADILTGHWIGVFRDPVIQAGPFELIFWGIPTLLGVHGTGAWVAFSLGAGALSIAAVSWLTARLLRDEAPVWRVPLAVAAGMLVALSGQVTTAMNAGHPAELVIALLWVGGALLARSGRPLAAGIVVGLSCGWELWGLLGVPVLLLAPRIDVRTLVRSGLGVVAAAALPFLPFVLLGPFAMFGIRWPIFDGTLIHLVFPGLTAFPWPIRLAQGALSVGSGVAVALLLRRRRDAVWLVPLVVCVVRFCLDPLLQPYYPLTAVVLASSGAVLGLARRSILQAVGCLALDAVLVDFGRLSPPTLIAALVITAATAVVVVRSPRADRPTARESVGVAK